MLYLHVGLHKTGTTFLQKSVFPKWSGITYIPNTNLEVFLRLEEGRTYLASREGFSGQNWAHHDTRVKSLERLSGIFPEARILVSFRKHSGYILSSYRQYLQRGGPLRFEDYFDLESDRGLLHSGDFFFRKKIEAIERFFGRRPFVFLNEELGSSLPRLLADLEGFIGGRAPSVEAISSKRHNKSVGYYPAKLLRRLNALSRSEFNPEGRFDLENGIFKKLHLTPKDLCKHWLSYVPMPNPRFLSEEQTSAIDAFYREDWDFVTRYAESRRETAGALIETVAAR